VKAVALVPVPAGVVTAIGPGTAPLGTVARSWLAATNVTLGEARPANLTVARGTKPLPVIVTVAPGAPDAGENDVTAGAPYP
jgi:hypothetical protein